MLNLSDDRTREAVFKIIEAAQEIACAPSFLSDPHRMQRALGRLDFALDMLELSQRREIASLSLLPDFSRRQMIAADLGLTEDGGMI